MTKAELRFDDFPHRVSAKIRYSDTDRQGHVNNAIFVTMLETGRVEVLYNPDSPLLAPGCDFVLARLVLDFRSEMRWPGEVGIGTAVTSIGRSSIRFLQGLYQDGRLVAEAETVSVQMDDATRKSAPLSDVAVQQLERLRLAPDLRE